MNFEKNILANKTPIKIVYHFGTLQASYKII